MRLIRKYFKLSLFTLLITFQVSAHLINTTVSNYIHKANAYIESAYTTTNYTKETITINDKEIPTEIPPVMKRIAKCESNNSHFDSKGNVTLGKVDKNDIGKYQISFTHHGKSAMQMGLNLWDEKDNETYALYLYHTQGTSLWFRSAKCWN